MEVFHDTATDVTCRIWDYPTQMNTPCLNPSHAGRYSIYLPRRDGRLSWPSSLDSAPAGSRTSDPRSRVRRPTTAPPSTVRLIVCGFWNVAEGRKYFRDFLRTEFSEENVLFWLACEELKRETNAELIEEKARSIYEDYISILSPKEVSFVFICVHILYVFFLNFLWSVFSVCLIYTCVSLCQVAVTDLKFYVGCPWGEL